MEKYKDKPFVLLGVNLDPDRAAAHQGIVANNLSWRSWWDGGDGKISDAYNTEFIPALFLIDAEGVLRGTISFEEVNTLEDRIDALLREVK